MSRLVSAGGVVRVLTHIVGCRGRTDHALAAPRRPVRTRSVRPHALLRAAFFPVLVFLVAVFFVEALPVASRALAAAFASLSIARSSSFGERSAVIRSSGRSASNEGDTGIGRE